MIRKGIKIVIVVTMVIISLICGCIDGGEKTEEELYFFDWAYHVCINNSNNVSFFLYLPIPILLNGTYIDVTSPKNLTNRGGNLSIEKTRYGYALNVSSTGSVNIGTGVQKRNHNIDIVDHMVLTMISTLNYSNLKIYDKEPIGRNNIWIYSNASNNAKLHIYVYFGYSWGKMIGGEKTEDLHNMFVFPRDIEIKNGWQLVECQPWGG